MRLDTTWVTTFGSDVIGLAPCDAESDILGYITQKLTIILRYHKPTF